MVKKNGDVRGKRKKLVKGLPDWKEVIRGSLMKYYLTCGTKGCRCHKDPKYKHGPYWYISATYRGGKKKMYKIQNDKVKDAKRMIGNYDKLWAALCRISEINIDDLRKK